MTFSRLKIAIKREQSQACLGYAEREQFGRSQNGKLNSRGFSNPWNTSWFNYRTVCKDGGFQYRWTFKSSATLPYRVFTDAFSTLPLYFHGFKNPRLFALWASRLSDVFAHCSLLIAHCSQLNPPQECTIRGLSLGIHTDLCRTRVII